MKSYTKKRITIYENDGEDEHILELKILFVYTPEEREVHTLPNGDPGHPGSGAEVDIYSITCDHLLFDEDKISEDTMEKIEERCFYVVENE